MSQAAPHSSAARRQEVDDEAFGQAGIRRYLLPVLARISLILCVVSVLMWQRSTQYADYIQITRPGDTILIGSAIGRVFVFQRISSSDATDIVYTSERTQGNWTVDPWPDSWGKTLGIGVGRGTPFGGWSRAYWVRLKWSTLAILTSVLPVIYFIRRRIQKRQLAAEHDPAE